MDSTPNIDEGRLTGLLRSERENCVGLDESSDNLSRERQKALKYYKGDMSDIVALENRSSATDSTVADTIETVLPDLMEIFTEEDVVSFSPVGDEDVDAARQETDFIKHVIFGENPGWLELHAAFKDALILREGVWKYWSELEEEVDKDVRRGLAPEMADMGEILLEQQADDSVEISDREEEEDGTVTLTILTKKKRHKICFKAVPCEDFGASNDGSRVKDTTYCVMRSRPRVQDLLEIYDDKEAQEKIKALSAWSDDEQTGEERDITQDQEDGNDTDNLLRQVEVYEHYLRTDLDGEGIKEWKIITGADEAVIIDIEEVDEKPFASITPFINPHRRVGESMADKTMQIQAIKTSLLRIMLDSAYFGLNQRMEVSEREAGDNTIGDLLANSPGVPIRSETGKAVRPIQAGGLNFDVLGALEQASVMSEQRSGVIRNNQGLNSDALHDTATGQQAQQNMGQRRVRMIARSFAETGFKDLCLGLHRLIRTSASGPLKARLRGKFVEVDPSSWGVRKDMEIQIGSGGKDEAIAAMAQLMSVIREIIEFQGGANGPLVDLTGMYQVLMKYTDLMPLKGIGEVFSDPAQAEPEPPKPDPEMAKIQSDAQLKQMELQQNGQAKMAEMQQSGQIKQFELKAKQESAALEAQLRREAAQLDAQLKRDAAREAAELARAKAEAENDRAERKFQFEAMMAERNAEMRISQNRPGGDLDK